MKFHQFYFELFHQFYFTLFSNNKTPVILECNLDINSFELVDVPSDKVNQNDVEGFIEYCHQNGFEPGEKQTGVIFDTATERCILCEIASHKGMMDDLAYYNKNVQDSVDCIIYESRNFYVTSELGAIKQGYLMIIPKQHFLSMAQMPTGLQKEYSEVMKDVEEILKGAYGNEGVVSFFEHGSNPSGKTSHAKSIVHAHLHVVYGFCLKPKYLEMVKMKAVDDIAEAKEHHYFSYQEGYDGELLIAMDENVYVQRQYPRQIMAEELGLAPGQYNWRKVKFTENIDATLYNIHCFLKNSKNISKRIRTRTYGFLKGYEQREN